LAFIGSPEIVTAMALSGQLAFDPKHDTMPDAQGRSFRLEAPEAPEFPPKGFTPGESGFIAPPSDTSKVLVEVDPKSPRLALLEPFAPHDGRDIEGALVLLKAAGKCTTDHISAAGPWLAYRGHLDKISDNMFLGAKNAFTSETGKGTDVLTGAKGVAFPALARGYKKAGQGWVVFGDTNYGEGSSREHAAMSPRWLGARAVVVRSFARIHETNLKKQGILALTFKNPGDYDLVQEADRVSIGLADFAPGRPLPLTLRHQDGSAHTIEVLHTFTPAQIGWFRAGSALNLIREQASKAK
jgi:aconitate hydratase